MNKKILLVIMTAFLLSGCGMFFYCPLNLPSRNKLSMYNYWSPETLDKRKRATETTIQDWVECGGKEDGWYQTPVPWSESTTTEEIIAASRQKVEEIERCMLDKGYRYVGKCDSEITRNSLACREGRR